VTNTDSDVFLTISNQQLFVLLSGRWYTAATHDGPWTYVAPNHLPADFSRIPPNSDKGDVLAHVSGTQAAQDAVADSYVPQTAAVNVHQFDQPPVEYDGDPNFQPVGPTVSGQLVTYAVNTDAAVILVNGQYYCCYAGVWYVGPTPTGPWQICTSVPQVIYMIPPSCPIYPVVFCYVYGFTPDEVYVGYLPGYTGCYDYDGVVVYGTGYHYKSWLGRRYYPRPCTFGFAARYNVYTGIWGFDFALSRGGGRSWIGVAPGRWVRSGGEWFGFGGFRPVYAHDLAHQTAAQRELAIDQTRRDAYHRNVYDRRTDIRNLPPEPIRPEGVRPGEPNDVYTDRDGNVYRKTIDGWETRQQNQWKPSEPPRIEPQAPRQGAPERGAEGQPPAREPQRVEPQAPQQQRQPDYGSLNNDYRARVSGDQRARMDQAPPQEAPRQEAPRQEAPPQEAPRQEAPRDNGGGGGGGGGGGEERGGRGR
jgi:hypothetical protein